MKNMTRQEYVAHLRRCFDSMNFTKFYSAMFLNSVFMARLLIMQEK